MINKHLRAFVLSAECGSFSKAAAKMYISPNALIKQINILEHHLGVQLFWRGSHGLKLTEAGEMIYREAKFLINHSGKVLEQAQTLSSSREQIVRLGSSLLRPGKAIVDLWKETSLQFPHIKLQVVPFDDDRNNYLQMISRLGENIDIVSGIFPSTNFGNTCNTVELARLPLCVAVPYKHRFADKKRLQLNDLKGERLIMVERGSTSYIDTLRDELEKNYPEIEIITVPHYDLSAFNLCEKLNAMMITAENWREVHPSLVTIPVDWEYYVPHGLLYPLHPTAAVQRFVNAIKKQAEKKRQK